MPDDKCTACSFKVEDLVPESPYITALAQVMVTGDVERVASWMCEAHRADLKAVVDMLRQLPPETFPPKRP